MANSKTYQRALARVEYLCASREYCEAEIADKLKHYALSQQEVDQMLQELRENGFIDHGRYAKSFTHDKYKFNAWGKLKIKAHLTAKNIDDPDIETAIEQISENDYKAIVYHELKKKWEKLNDTDLYKKKGKLFRFAQSRGYEFEWVQRFLDERGNGHG